MLFALVVASKTLQTVKSWGLATAIRCQEQGKLHKVIQVQKDQSMKDIFPVKLLHLPTCCIRDVTVPQRPRLWFTLTLLTYF